MKISQSYQFVFRVLAVFALTAGLFLGTEIGSSAQGDTIGTQYHPIKILFNPSADPQVIYDGGLVMANYLQDETGLFFEVNIPSSPAATVEEMCASPNDSMGFLPGFGYVLANDLCGVDVSKKSIYFGWDVSWSEILVRRDSGIQSVAQLNGQTWGMPDYTSYIGYMAPMAMWNQAGITPGEIFETGGHADAVMAVYNGEVAFATSYFNPPRKPEGESPWKPGDDPDIPDALVEDCGISPDGKLMCDGWRVMDARTRILDDAPDVVQEVRILELSPPISNDNISFGPDFPAALRTQIENAMVAFALSPQWGDSIGRIDFYWWQGISPAIDADYNFTREIVAATGYDIDGDNVADVEDNAPTRFNPDQSDIDSDTIGDVADICPSDPLDECNAFNSTSESVGSEGGSLSTPQGSVGMDIPASALGDETSMSITDTGTGFGLNTNLGEATAVFAVEIGPPGTSFATPITLQFAWDDVDHDGIVDGTSQKEHKLFIVKDGIAITPKCDSNPDCNMEENTLTFQVDSLSEFALVTLLTPQQATESLIDILQDIVNAIPGTPLADKVEDAIAKLGTALDELNKIPPDNQAAVGNLEGAVGEIEAAVKDGLLDPTQGTQFMDQIAGIPRQLAVNAIDLAIAREGDPEEINEAHQYLAEGDTLRSSGAFKDAVNKYKDALAKAEGALP